jgi:hypothetical protein
VPPVSHDDGQVLHEAVSNRGGLPDAADGGQLRDGERLLQIQLIA